MTFRNFIEETCTGTGTTITLTGPTDNSRDFNDIYTNGEQFSYVIEDANGVNVVGGIGTYNTGDTITRNDTFNFDGTGYDDAPTGNLTLSAGTHIIRVAPLASDMNNWDAAYALLSGGTITGDITHTAVYRNGIYDFLDLDDDDNGLSGGTNNTTLSSIANMQFITDANNNGTGGFFWGEGAIGGTGANELMTLSHSGNLTVTSGGIFGEDTSRIRNNNGLSQQLELRPISTTTSGYQANLLLRYRDNGTANYIGTSSNQIWFGTYNTAIPSDPSDMIIMVPGTDDSPELLIGDSGSSQPKIIIRGSVGGVGSTAGLQNNSFMRTGNIYLHEGGNNPTAANGILSNTSGVLEWDTNTVWHSGNLASEYYSGDLDSITTQGFYFANTSATNKPANSAVLHLPYVNSNDFDSQIAVSHATDSMYFRSKDSGVWESWKEVWHDARNTFSMPAGASLATVGGMYFDIDTDNNSTSNFFQWRHNGSTELLTLTDEATLSLGALGTTDSWIRTHYTDGFWTQMRGYGIETNRGTFYIRPAAETQVARFGYHEGNLAWSTTYIDNVNGLYVRGGFTDIDTPDADFIVKDSNDTVTNYIWRDHSASALYLGTQGDANITVRSDILTNSSAYDIGSSSTRFNEIWGQTIDISGNSNFGGIATFNNVDIDGSGSRGMLLFNESAPIRQSLSDNYQYLDCVPNSPTNMNRMQFYLPTTAEYSTDNGSNWNPTGWTTEQLGNLMMGRFGGTSIQITNGAWTDLRLVWDTSVTSNPNGYVFLKFLHIYNAPKDNNVSYQVERQDFDTSTWTDLIPETANQGGWPTHVSLPHTSTAYTNSSGRYKAVRIRFRFTWAGAQNYDLYSINWYGTYPASTHDKVWYWDRDKNFYTRGNIRALDGSVSAPSYTFQNDTDTGFYWNGVNGETAYSAANNNTVIFDSSGIRTNQIEGIAFTSRIDLNNNDNYMDFISQDTAVSGIRVRDGNSTIRGYLYSDATNQFGLLTAAAEWGVRCTSGANTYLYYDNIVKYVTTSYGGAIYGTGTKDTNADAELRFLDSAGTHLATVGPWYADSVNSFGIRNLDGNVWITANRDTANSADVIIETDDGTGTAYQAARFYGSGQHLITGTLTLDSTGDSANGLRLRSDTNATNSPRLFFEDQSGDAVSIMSSNGNMTFRYGAGWNVSSGTIAATMNATTGQFTFNGPLSVNNDTMYINGYIYHNGDTNCYFGFSADDQISFTTAGSERLRLTQGGNLYMMANGSHYTAGLEGSGQAFVGGSKQNTDSAALDYGAYIAYDAYWDDTADAWAAKRTTLGRKWMTKIGGYHTNEWSINYYDGDVSGTWADADWTELVKVTSSGVLESAQFKVKGSGTILQLENDAWGTEPLHTVMTNGYNTTIQDYLMLKASGNSSTGHGSLIIADLGLYFGRHNEEDASNIANSTTPFSFANLFNVNNSGDGFFGGVVTADAFNLSTADGYAAKEFRDNVAINNTSYTNIANLTGTNLGSHVRMSVVGTASSVVVSAIFDINVNHSTDVTVKSMSGGYTQLKLRIISDNNEDFSIQLQHDGSTSALTVNVNIYPLNNETVTFSTTAAQTATTHDHQTYPFSSTHTQTGGGDGHHLRTDGRLYLGGDFTNYLVSIGGDYLRAVTQYGHFDFGPRNTSYCHLQTDMPEFYFNTGVSINGDLTPYSPSGDYDLGSTSEPWAISYVTNSIVNEINDIDTGYTLYRSSDTWLRLNPDGDFTSGIYCGSAPLRVDGTFQVGSGGSVFNLNGSTGQITASCASAGGQGLVLRSTQDQTSGVTFYGPGLLWQDDSANNLAGIRGGRGSDDTTNFLALGTGWLDQEMVIYPTYVDFAAEIRVSTWVTAASGIRHESDTNNNITFGTDTQTFNTAGTARIHLTSNGENGYIRGNYAVNSNDTGGGYSTCALEMREVGLVSNTQTGDDYAPAISFHWGGRNQGKLWMQGGTLNWTDGTGGGSYSDASKNIATGTFIASQDVTVGGNSVLTTATSFGGDVSGTYNSIVVANDSHTHAFNNLTGKSSGTGFYSTTGQMQAHDGFVGNYDDTASGAWAGPIWGMDDGFTGDIGGANSAPTSCYGLRWNRASAADANSNIGEGLYVYQNGLLQGGIGVTGGYIDGLLEVTGNADFGAGIDVTGNITITSGIINHTTAQTRDKIRVWNSSLYAIGMDQTFTFGGLNGYAMTFQMNDTADRGWWWGHNNQSDSQGAMSLTNAGELAVADSIRVGYGTSDTTSPGTYDLEVSGTASIGSTLEMNDQIVDQPKLRDYAIAHENWEGTSTSKSLDCSLYNSFKVDLDQVAGAGVTLSFTNPSATGNYCEIKVMVIQDVGSVKTVTWPASVKWSGGTAPSLTGTDAAVDIFHFFTIDGGTNWYGSYGLDFS